MQVSVQWYFFSYDIKQTRIDGMSLFDPVGFYGVNLTGHNVYTQSESAVLQECYDFARVTFRIFIITICYGTIALNISAE